RRCPPQPTRRCGPGRAARGCSGVGILGIRALEYAHRLSAADALARLGHLHHVVFVTKRILLICAERCKLPRQEVESLLFVHLVESPSRVPYSPSCWRCFAAARDRTPSGRLRVPAAWRRPATLSLEKCRSSSARCTCSCFPSSLPQHLEWVDWPFEVT